MVIQIYGILVTVVYAAIVTLVILLVIKAVIGLRVSDENELEGLDLTQHGEVVH